MVHRAIRQARKSRDRSVLGTALSKVRESTELSSSELERLRPDVREAQDLLTRMERAERLCARILTINNRAILEMRSYSRPDPDIHTTIQATLLLLGHYEKRTRVSVALCFHPTFTLPSLSTR